MELKRISDTKSLLALNRREDSYSDRVLEMKMKPKTIRSTDDTNDRLSHAMPTTRSQLSRVVENSIDSVESASTIEIRNEPVHRKYSFRKSLATRRGTKAYEHRLTLFNNLFGLKGSWFGMKKRESESPLGDEVNGYVDVTGTTRQERQFHSIAKGSTSLGLWKKLYLTTHKMVQKPDEEGRKLSFPIEEKAVQFVTKSLYQGYWNPIFENMHREGLYMMPHGVIYEGEMEDGMFHGHGVLHYPNGCSVEGTWVYGENTERKFVFGDGNDFEDDNFNYCKKPDRRYATELEKGLKPAGRSQITNEDPPRLIPDGCYDAGSGFYNPLTKSIMNPKTGDIMRVPIGNEEEWIIEHCRKAWDENVGFRPDLYEDWFQKEEEVSSDEDVISKNLQELSVEGSFLAFSPSQMKMMQDVLNRNSSSLDPNNPMKKDSSSVNESSFKWIKSSSRHSMEVGGEPRLDWIHKVNVDFAVSGESRVSDIPSIQDEQITIQEI